jgi:hypothetical protein
LLPLLAFEGSFIQKIMPVSLVDGHYYDYRHFLNVAIVDAIEIAFFNP